jgi:hypothetical protein
MTLAEVLDRFRDLGERDEVAQPPVDGKDTHGDALILGEVVTAEVVGRQTRQREVLIVHQHVLDAGVAQRARQGRFPHPLGQPHAARTHAELGPQERAQALDLTPFVGIGQDGQDRLVEAAGEELDAPTADDLAEEIERRARVRAQPLEQAARAVDGQPHLGPGPEPLEERPVRSLGGLDENAVEVPDRLVVVNAEAECQRTAVHDYSRSRSRCTTPAARPSRSRNPFSSSTSATERCRPPVQPTATVR